MRHEMYTSHHHDKIVFKSTKVVEAQSAEMGKYLLYSVFKYHPFT